ncbi:MAG: hypothetical protein QOG21_2563 [Actinomycetota bacterium]|nr:hypothetical protein [Actinomycetota bacterium]
MRPFRLFSYLLFGKVVIPVKRQPIEVPEPLALFYRPGQLIEFHQPESNHESVVSKRLIGHRERVPLR